MKRRAFPCPFCNAGTKVDYTRHPGETVRRRECLECKKTFRTVQGKEILEPDSMGVTTEAESVQAIDAAIVDLTSVASPRPSV